MTGWCGRCNRRAQAKPRPSDAGMGPLQAQCGCGNRVLLTRYPPGVRRGVDPLANVRRGVAN